MKRLLRFAGLTLLILGVGAVFAYLGRHELMRMNDGLGSFTHSAGAVCEQSVAMRDGIELATTTYEPEGDGPWPTVLIRNPYDKAGLLMRPWCERLVRYGYACVYQEARGQGASEGDWNPFVNEVNDGHDTLAWLIAQAGLQNGNIAFLGPSYLAGTQWATATGGLPPEVKTFIPAVFSTNFYDVVYQGGMFRLETFAAWSALMPRRGMAPDGAGAAFRKAIRHRPHIEVDELYFGGRIPWYREWVSSAAFEAPLWRRDDFLALTKTPGRLKIPVLMIGGWYDVFIGPQMQDWQRLATKSSSHFVVGPWTHVLQGSDDFGTPDARGGMLMWHLVLDWLGHHLRGEPLVQPLGIETYTLGADEWITRPSWPPPSQQMRLHFGSLPRSQSCSGGSLGPEAPAEREEVIYRYHPDHPVPTRGGAGMLAFLLPGFDGAPPSNVWQERLCERPDILSFSSEQLKTELHIAGDVEVVLTVASSAPDTAFTAKLVEVFDDGREINVRDGITSLAFRNGATSAQKYRPGSETTIALKLWPIEWEFQVGSRVRLDVSSSDFPKFVAHTNRAGPWAEQSGADVADQTVIAAPGKPGWLGLPVVTPP